MGSRLKEYRLRRELQQQEMALEAGVSLLTVARLERGENVSLDSLLRIMRVLRMLENIEGLVPEPPLSPVLYAKLMGKKRYRIKKHKLD